MNISKYVTRATPSAIAAERATTNDVTRTNEGGEPQREPPGQPPPELPEFKQTPPTLTAEGMPTTALGSYVVVGSSEGLVIRRREATDEPAVKERTLLVTFGDPAQEHLICDIILVKAVEVSPQISAGDGAASDSDAEQEVDVGQVDKS